MFTRWCEQLVNQAEMDVGFRKCGGWYLARTHGELATLSASELWWEEHGIRFERWKKETKLPPLKILQSSHEAGRLLGAWYLPDEWQIRNPRYLKALEKACKRLGVVFRECESVVGMHSLVGYPPSGLNPRDAKRDTRLVASNDLVELQTSLRSYHAKSVCITTGAWTPLIGKNLLPLETGIVPIRGQMILLKLASPIFDSIINEGHRYLVPRDDGHLLVGSCEEEAGYDEQPTEEMKAELLEWAYGLVPELRQAEVVKSWAGLRPGSVDGLPYLGPVPSMPGVFVAAGHYRHGLHWSPITASIMVDIMTGRSPAIDIEPFRLTRGKTYSNPSSR